jgi:serine/threonine protein kinase
MFCHVHAISLQTGPSPFSDLVLARKKILINLKWNPPAGAIRRMCYQLRLPSSRSNSTFAFNISFHCTDAQLRSPEEVEGSPLDEKIDVYSLGNVFYSILTGLLVNRDYTISQAHSRIRNGITEEIDVGFFESRSSAELALVKVIQWCWEFDAEKRPSIFEIVDFLDEEVNKLNYIN